LVEAATNGTEIIVTKAGQPRARLIACEQPPKTGRRRKLLAKDKISISD
jgi:antitoxin (DNA-binding transcriptional repressor) of toxin-antitoxin stability system